jgi:integrase
VRKHWPKVHFKEKRGVTVEEHKKILAGECNPEWRAYYQMLWHTGGAQSDVANLRGENVDWQSKVISFSRMKTGTVVQLHFGNEAEQVLSDLPGEGFLFPSIAGMKESDRAKAFIRRLRLVKVSGISLHSYRYAWAERAKTVGYPERFAQEALGHSSKAVHRAYARHALVKIPSLEDYEKRAEEKAAAPA